MAEAKKGFELRNWYTLPMSHNSKQVFLQCRTCWSAHTQRLFALGCKKQSSPNLLCFENSYFLLPSHRSRGILVFCPPPPTPVLLQRTWHVFLNERWETSELFQMGCKCVLIEFWMRPECDQDKFWIRSNDSERVLSKFWTSSEWVLNTAGSLFLQRSW